MAYDEVIRNPNGGGIIICRRGGHRPPSCSYCSLPGTQLCDYEISPGKTCDRPICKPHSAPGSAPNTDYCREHAQFAGLQRNKPTVLPGISIKQPWAWLIDHAPVELRKNYENRTRKWHYRGPFLIHAGIEPVPNWKYVCATVYDFKGIVVDPNATCGAITGISTIVDCVDATKYNLDDAANFWLQGPYGYKLENSRPFSKPIPYKGSQGIMTIKLEAVIIEQIKEHPEYVSLV